MTAFTNPRKTRPIDADLRHTPGMLRRSTIGKVLWIVAIAVLAIRGGDAHLHLCGDGQEQPVALHMLDAPGQHHDQAEAGHNDRDLDVSAPALVKKTGDFDDLTLAAVLTFAWVSLAPVVAQIEPIAAAHPLPITSLFFLRPPLRGPPL